MKVSIGIDSHKSTLVAAAVDELGRVVSVEVFANDSDGHGALLEWRRPLEGDVRIGIESPIRPSMWSFRSSRSSAGIHYSRIARPT